MFILQIGDKRILHIFQIRKNGTFRHILFRQSEETHILVNDIADDES